MLDESAIPEIYDACKDWLKMQDKRDKNCGCVQCSFSHAVLDWAKENKASFLKLKKKWKLKPEYKSILERQIRKEMEEERKAELDRAAERLKWTLERT